MGREIPEYLKRMVCRPAPSPEVVDGTTPVLSFGDPHRTQIATLGINPSGREFVENGRLLTGQQRRLATLESLGACSTSRLTERQIRTVVEECASYFCPNRNPYRRWFDILDSILRNGLGVSYYDGSACHLDLVQWATNPIWGKLPDHSVKKRLLRESLPHLQNQLRFAKIRLLLLNGREVLDQVVAVGLAQIVACGTLRVGAVSCSLYLGEGEGVRIIGWSTNLQSSHGVTLEFRKQLSNWLAVVEKREANMQNNSDDTTDSQAKPIKSSADMLDDNGHFVNGTSARGKDELFRLLKDWLEASNAPTIGNVGTFGRSPCIFITLDRDVTAVLNADTKREAIKQYVEDSLARGSDAAWSVIPNRNGIPNKLVFRADGAATPGWYCYSRLPLSVQQKL